MFGKLSWDAIPFYEPIPLHAGGTIGQRLLRTFAITPPGPGPKAGDPNPDVSHRS